MPSAYALGIFSAKYFIKALPEDLRIFPNRIFTEGVAPCGVIPLRRTSRTSSPFRGAFWGNAPLKGGGGTAGDGESKPAKVTAAAKMAGKCRFPSRPLL